MKIMATHTGEMTYAKKLITSVHNLKHGREKPKKYYLDTIH